jgi:ribosomal protein S18 acetylase RimI-like enzyme
MSVNDEIKIRSAGIDDAEPLARLGAQTFYDTFVNSCSSEDLEAYLAAAYTVAQLAGELVDPRAMFFIAEVGGAMVGYGKLAESETPDCVTGAKPIELARLYTVRERHGRGVGEALMRAMLDEAKRRGRETIWLGVWEHNERAKAFYRKWKFELVGEHIFPVGNDPQNDLLMARAL